MGHSELENRDPEPEFHGNVGSDLGSCIMNAVIQPSLENIENCIHSEFCFGIFYYRYRVPVWELLKGNRLW
jgi:hypothetical protein